MEERFEIEKKEHTQDTWIVYDNDNMLMVEFHEGRFYDIVNDLIGIGTFNGKGFNHVDDNKAKAYEDMKVWMAKNHSDIAGKEITEENVTGEDSNKEND